MEVRRYALRRLNPFRGVTQIIEIDAARALTHDGLSWELQIATERPAGWGSLNLGRTETLFCRFGVWTAAEGLARFPLHAAIDRNRLQQVTTRLVDVLESRNDAAAFELADRFECWLLSADTEQPLALLAAVNSREAIPERLSSRWHAAPADNESLHGLGRDAADQLERWVARRGGARVWFERLPDDRRRKVGAGETAAGSGEAFPELLLDTHWPVAEATLVADYLDWLAPRLLMLPLAAATRTRLEQAAVRQVEAVAAHFRLYPQVIDQAALTAARVQAQLKAAAG